MNSSPLLLKEKGWGEGQIIAGFSNARKDILTTIYKHTLSNAALSNAHLIGTYLIGTDRSNTSLTGASLIGADLSISRNLTLEQVGEAKLCQTKLPRDIKIDPNRDCKELGISLNVTICALNSE